MLISFLRFLLGFGIVVAGCFTFAALFHLADIPMPWLQDNALYCELQRELAFPEAVAFTQEEYLRAALGYGMQIPIKDACFWRFAPPYLTSWRYYLWHFAQLYRMEIPS